MKPEYHLQKAERFKATLAKLDSHQDYETVIEDCLLTAAHLINAALHATGKLQPDRDIKHDLLFGTLSREKPLEGKSDELAALVQELEQLRPSHVYGKGENGNTAKRAEELLRRISTICEEAVRG